MKPTPETSAGPLRGILVGAGFFAGFQAEAWNRMAGAGLVGICDRDAARAQAFAEKYGVADVATDLGMLLDRTAPDFVDLVTRPDVRRAIVDLVSARGLPVLCQKPLADTWAEAVEIVQLCQKRGTRILVHENWRFQPWFREAKRLIDGGAIGKPSLVSFRMRTGDGRGPAPYAAQPYFRDMKHLLVHETCVHFLDTFRYLMGDITRVNCVLARMNPIIAGEDAAWIQLGFAGDTYGTIDANRLTGPDPAPVAFGQTLLEGEGGSLRIDVEGNIWIAGTPGGPEKPHQYRFSREGYKGDSVLAFQEHAVAALRTNTPAETEGAAYLHTLAAVFSCYRSAREGRPVSPQEIWDEK